MRRAVLQQIGLINIEWVATPVLATLLVWICVVDVRSYRIPDTASLGLVALGLALSPVSAVAPPIPAMIGAVTGYGLFALTGWIYFRRTGVEGLGLGDAKLLAAAGAWLGWVALPGVISVAAIGGLTFAVLTRRRRLAFGPWLAGAFWVHWIAQIA